MTTRSSNTAVEPIVYFANVPLVLIKDTSGAVHHVYDGQAVPKNAAAEEIERLHGLGFIAATAASPPDE